MQLFDDHPRVDLTPKKRGAPYIDYLDSSAREEMARVRNLLQSWYVRYPETSKPELKARLRSAKGFDGAFFELFLHEMLLRLGCTITLHPFLEGTSHRPEFRVVGPDTSAFYLEAATARGAPPKTQAGQKRLDDLLDAIDSRITSPDFLLHVDYEGLPATQPPIKKIVGELTRWLEGLHPEEVARQHGQWKYDASYCFSWKYDGLTIRIKPIPRNSWPRDPTDTRSIASGMTVFCASGFRKSLKDALARKAYGYGYPDLPFIVALNAPRGVSDDTVIESILGSEAWTFSWSDKRIDQIEGTRLRDGAWLGHDGPHQSRLSGLLMVTKFSTPDRLANAQAILYHNPWAEKPCPTVLGTLSQRIPDYEHYRRIDGLSIADMFELPPPWPEQEP